MIVFVIVIYCIEINNCTTFLSLKESINRGNFSQYKIIIVDNTPNKLKNTIELCENIVYMINGKNTGLPFSYNLAIKYAKKIAGKFLVTLDQDSIVTLDYLTAVFSNVNRLADKYVALCPIIKSSDRIVSPFCFNKLGFPAYGKINKSLFGINSFSVYLVKYIVDCGGFDEFYWLDALDLCIYAKIKQKKYSAILLDVEVSHDLSLLSGKISQWRLLNMAKYEACFLFEYCEFIHIITGLFRLFGRSIKVGANIYGIKYIFLVIYFVLIGSWRGILRKICNSGAVVWI